MVFRILYYLILIGAVVVVILENRKPKVGLLWVMVLTFLPGVGLVLYLLFGKDYRSRRVIKRDEMLSIEALRDESNSEHIISAPENPCYVKLANMMRGANGAPLFNGNDTKIYTEFAPMFNDMLADIAAAKSFVHIQFYIIEDDEVGRQLSDLLIRKAQEGVDVRLMFDSWANLFVRGRYYDEMRRGGVKVQSFLKLIPSIMTRDVNCRTHRKIVVIDGQKGYTGGMNIARRYRDGVKRGIWRDTHIRIEGPAVTQLEVALLADWRFCTHELLSSPTYLPAVPPAPANRMCQIVTSGPMDEWNTVMQGMVQIIAQSQRYLYLQTPYFIPTQPILLAIRNAAIAGVDVRLMIPGSTDRGAIMLYASESFFKELMMAGVKIYLYSKGYLHAKTMVCDDDFVTIGSTNIDSRSMEQNFEVNAFFYDKQLAMQQRDIFLADQQECQQVDPDEWQHRPLGHKFLESLSRLCSPLL